MKINKQVRLSVVGFTLAGLAMIFANLPFQYDTASTDGRLQLDVIQRATDSEDVVHPIAAGWPAKFYYHYDHGKDVPVYTRWSPASLLLNVGLTLGVLLVILLAQRRAAKIRGTAEVTRRRQVSIADLILLTFLISLPLGYWQWLKRYEQRELAIAKQLQRYGSYQRSADLPAAIIPYLPGPFVSACMRVTDVDLNAPDDKALAAAMQLPHLRSLRIGGGQYDLRHLDALPNLTDLTVLQLSGRVLDARCVQVVSVTERLRMLDMSRTNLSAAAVALIGELPRLETLILTDTGVQLADLTAPICPATLERLELPRPEPGVSDEVGISGYPVLQALVFNSRDAGPNASVFQIHLKDLPMLNVLQLDLLQKYALQLERLPVLTKVDRLNNDSKLRLTETESIPFVFWLESLSIDELARLQEFNFYAAELQQIQIRNTPELALVGVGMGRISQDGSVNYEKRFSPKVLDVLLEGLADSDGPELLDMAFVPLAGADLQPLARNPRLTALNLASSQTSVKQWQSLRDMSHLVHLNVSGNEEEGNSLESLVRQFPNLETITLGMQTLRSLTIKDHSELAYLQLDSGNQQPLSTLIESPFLHRVQLVNLPRLANTFRFSPWTANIHLEGLPAVKGLAFQRPLPAGTVLKGVRDLEWFAAGGPAIDDAIADELLQCGNIQHLTLAYSAVSKHKIRALIHANPIRTLDLSGSEIDDTVLEDWEGLGELQEIVLDETQVTEQTLTKLVAAENLSMMSINGIAMNEDLLAKLTGLKQLAVLRIAGTPCRPEILGRLLQSLPLTELDLSGQAFSAEHAQAILDAGGNQLRLLGLRDSKIDPQAITRLANSIDGLRFDIAGADLPASTQGNLLASGRLLVDENDSGVAVFSGFMGATDQTETPSTRICPSEAIIDVKRFAPDTLNSIYE